MGIESRLVWSPGAGVGKGMRSDYPPGMGFPWEWWKCGTGESSYLHNFVSVLSTTELYTLTWLLWWILCEFYHNKNDGEPEKKWFFKINF